MPDIKPFIVTGLAIGSVYALSGIGLVVLYRATAVLNFSYGAVGALGALTAWDLIDRGTPEPIAWLVCLVVATLLSLGYGTQVAPRLADRDLVSKAMGTVGLMVMVLGFALWHWPDIPRTLTLPTSDHGFTVFGVKVVATKVLALAAAIGLALGVTEYLDRTRSGLHMRAMADDPAFADMLGIRTERVGAIAWGISGALSGISGLLVADLVRLDVGALTFLVVPAMAAAVIGGMSSLSMTLLGGLIVGVAESGLAPFDSVTKYRTITPFVVAIAALVWRQRTTTVAVVAAQGR